MADQSILEANDFVTVRTDGTSVVSDTIFSDPISAVQIIHIRVPVMSLSGTFADIFLVCLCGTIHRIQCSTKMCQSIRMEAPSRSLS